MTKYLTSRPPDGGYGWVVVAASFICSTLQFGVIYTVGVFYVIFLDKLDASEPAIALIPSLNTAACYMTGPLAGALTNVFGIRRVTMVGGLVASLGFFLSTFSQNVYHFYATFGIITGFGLGLTYIPAIAIVAEYFERKRSMALGFAVSGVGFGTLIFPLIIRYFVEYYGWRGTFLIMAGLCLHLCLCGALFRPIRVSTHMPTTHSDAKRKPRKNRISESFNVHIFSNPHYVLLCLNSLLFFFGQSVVFVHLSEYAQTIGFTENQGALLFSVVGCSSIVGRIGLGLIALAPAVNPTLLYLACYTAAGVATAFVPVATSLPALMTYAAAFGAFTASVGPLLPQVLVKILNLKLLQIGYGYVCVFGAVGAVLGAPVAGWLFISTREYASSFYLGGAAMIGSGALMIWPWLKPRKPHSAESLEVNSEDIGKQVGKLKDEIKEGQSHMG